MCKQILVAFANATLFYQKSFLCSGQTSDRSYQYLSVQQFDRLIVLWYLKLNIIIADKRSLYPKFLGFTLNTLRYLVELIFSVLLLLRHQHKINNFIYYYFQQYFDLFDSENGFKPNIDKGNTLFWLKIAQTQIYQKTGLFKVKSLLCKVLMLF